LTLRLASPRDASPRAKCVSNLHQIGLAILLYQQDHGGQYPDTLGRLTETEQIGPDVFVCPESNDQPSTGPTTRAISDEVTAGPAGHHCSYVYIGRGLTDKTVTPTTIVAYDAPDDHGGDGGNALYGDGHVDWLNKADAAKVLPAWAAAMRPAR
jgi:prepilin-type processing-associated H-X9-DG protein